MVKQNDNNSTEWRGLEGEFLNQRPYVGSFWPGAMCSTANPSRFIIPMTLWFPRKCPVEKQEVY